MAIVKMASEEFAQQVADEKYEKPSGGIPKSDMSAGVQASLDKADTALQEHQSLAAYVNAASYDSTAKKILLKHDDTIIAEVDATAFIKDGMVSSVEIEDGRLVITFNTDAGLEPIEIPLTDIFNPANYYDKTAADGKFVAKEAGKGLSTEDYTTAEKTKLDGIAAGAQVNIIEGVKVNGTALTPTNKVVNVVAMAETATGADIAVSGTDATKISAAINTVNNTATAAGNAASTATAMAAAAENKANLALYKIPYSLGTPIVIDTASSEVVEGETVYYGAATLADRTANIVQVTAATALDELRITFPAATSGKVRDFGLRVEIGTGSAALAAPALVPIAPTGETIKIENADGTIPELADGTATAKGVTLLYFSENAPGVFVVKGEQVEEVA